MNRQMFVSLFLAVAMIAGCNCGKSKSTPEMRYMEYSVKKGDYLRKIADKQGVTWEAILLVNEKGLKDKYDKTCGSLSRHYTDNPRRHGTFCNSLYKRAYGNTLKPGWALKIPARVAPPEIEKQVANIKGDRIALVIDDTGSMLDNRREVSEFYLAAMKKYGKEIVGVWLYADGSVRHYDETASVEYRMTGGVENTLEALKDAADEEPDAIVLITDERGDDWDEDKIKDLPKVIAHCLSYDCRQTLTHLASVTGGQYVGP